MTEVRALIERLIAAGVDPIEAAEVVTRAAVYGAASAPKARSAGAIRQERYRRNKASQVTENNACDAPSPEVSPHTPLPNPNPKPPSPPKGGSSPIDRAIEVFSEAAKRANLPVPRKVTPDRRRKIDARLREHGESVWAEACRKMAESSFCRGENERGWRADLDFLCQPKSFNGLIEGKYDDRPNPRSNSPPVHRQRTMSDVFAEIASGTYQGPPSDDDRHEHTIETGFARRN